MDCTAYSGSSISGMPNKFLVDDGCEQDSNLMGSDFDNEESGVPGIKRYWAVLYVFKFYNSNDIFFSCTVTVCPSGSSSCDISCSKRKRSAGARQLTGPDDKVFSTSQVLHILPGTSSATTTLDTTTEENVSNESSNECLSVKESCATENQTDDKSVPGDPGGEATVEKATNNQEEDCDANNSGNCETVEFKVIFNKQKFDVNFPMDNTVRKLKEHVQTLTGVPSAMQKIMYKGLAKDESSLRDLKVIKGAKIMVVGSTMNDVLSVNAPNLKEIQEESKAASSKEPLSQQKQHKKVLDKYGKPDDVMPGIKNSRQALPPQPLSGMYNKSGGKVRLTFKLELDQVWLGTKERTEKLPMNSIKAVVSEPLDGHEEYHMMGLQLGPTEASRYWIYWVPAQYVEAIKDTVLGKWQFY